jgi:2-(1,2-epoxy-1,2-dihydrophenyl)acetyl-CoA isomerase
VTYQKIEVEIRDNVGVVRFNDPTTLNAMGPLMAEEVGNAVSLLASSVRAILIMGRGRGFCSGAALSADLTGPGSTRSERDFGEILETHLNPLMSKLRNLPVPWVSAVHGAAAGVGASLALAADLIVASESAYFLQAFTRIGLTPDGGSSHLLVKTIGRVRAMELLLLAERLPAAKALEWGLINRVVADAALEHEAFKLASQLARGPAIALGLARQIAWSAVDDDWEAILKREREAQRIAGRTRDADEGINAFIEKRIAVFTGT